MTKVGGFFVGIGAQRAGTTWLAHMFDRHPEVGMCPVKETHYWTSKYVEHQRNAVRGLQAAKTRMPQLLRHCLMHPMEGPNWVLSYLGMMAHQDKSYRKFIELGRYGCPIAGEITPAYATLSAEALSALDACLDRPRYIFILRNPADRFISQIAHSVAWDPSVLTSSVSDLLARPYFAMRSTLESTFATCKTAVERERLHTLFYEDLFDPQDGQATFDAICAFLGVKTMPIDIDQVINARAKPRFSGDRLDIVALLQSDYHFAHRQFGHALPSNWASDLDLIESLPAETSFTGRDASC